MTAVERHRRGGHRPPLRLSVTFVLSAVAGALLLAPAGGQAAQAAGVAPLQDTVTLLGSQTVRARPAASGRKVANVSARRPLTSARTVLPMLAQIQDDHGKFWFRVRLPGRALGGATPPRTGWISASKTTRSTTPWHIVISVGSRRVIAYRDGVKTRSFAAIVGATSTPTPRGDYFVEENVKLSAGRAGAPYALALSARSGVFQEFEGGPGQIALHGLNNIGGRLGTAVSHGCVRLSTASVMWLASRMRSGTPVTIT
jgi:lipoprotein-anchoring transpeptidase ErfK/SrfK